MKELGHRSLKETVKYANLRMSKVASDFPSLNLKYNGGKRAKNGDVDYGLCRYGLCRYGAINKGIRSSMK